jgi:hypothetical protein
MLSYLDHGQSLPSTYGYGADLSRTRSGGSSGSGVLSVNVLQRLYDAAKANAQRTFEIAWATPAFTKAREAADKAHNAAVKERDFFLGLRDNALRGKQITLTMLTPTQQKRYAAILKSALSSGTTSYRTPSRGAGVSAGTSAYAQAGGTSAIDAAVSATGIVPDAAVMQSAAAVVEPTILGIPTTTALIGAGVLVAGYFLLGKKKPVAGKYRQDVG